MGEGGQVRPVWSLGGADFGTTLSTVAIADGILYAADFAGLLRAIDVETDRQLWDADTLAAIWGCSPLVADGKVYVGNEDGNLLVFAAGRERKLLATNDCGSAIYTTPAAAGSVLYVATRDRLLALAAPPPGPAPAPPHGG